MPAHPERGELHPELQQTSPPVTRHPYVPVLPPRTGRRTGVQRTVVPGCPLSLGRDWTPTVGWGLCGKYEVTVLPRVSGRLISVNQSGGTLESYPQHFPIQNWGRHCPLSGERLVSVGGRRVPGHEWQHEQLLPSRHQVVEHHEELVVERDRHQLVVAALDDQVDLGKSPGSDKDPHTPVPRPSSTSGPGGPRCGGR